MKLILNVRDNIRRLWDYTELLEMRITGNRELSDKQIKKLIEKTERLERIIEHSREDIPTFYIDGETLYLYIEKVEYQIKIHELYDFERTRSSLDLRLSNNSVNYSLNVKNKLAHFYIISDCLVDRIVKPCKNIEFIIDYINNKYVIVDGK